MINVIITIIKNKFFLFFDNIINSDTDKICHYLYM